MTNLPQEKSLATTSDSPKITAKNNIFYVKRSENLLEVEFGSNIDGVNVVVGPNARFLNHFKNIPPPDILIIENDYNMTFFGGIFGSYYMEIINKFKGKIYPNVDMHYFIASKQYYVDILPDYVIPGTVIVKRSYLCQNKLELESEGKYIFKLPFTPSSEVTYEFLLEHEEKIGFKPEGKYFFKPFTSEGISKGKSLCKKLGDNTGKIIIQPFLSEINEFKFFVINGDIFYPSVIVDKDLIAHTFYSGDYVRNGFTEAQKISVESLVSVIFNKVKAKYDQLIYLRIDIIYDVLTKKFYLNEIESFASDKFSE